MTRRTIFLPALLVGFLLCSLTPVGSVVHGEFFVASAEAQQSGYTKKKVQRLFKQLRKLPNGASQPGKVRGLAVRLVKLDPKKAARYFKTALRKFPVTSAERNQARETLESVLVRSPVRVVRGNIAQRQRLAQQVSKISGSGGGGGASCVPGSPSGAPCPQ